MPRKPVDPARRVMPLAEWPTEDRAAWEAGIVSGGALDEPAPAAHLRPATLAKIRRSYGRWLGYCAHARISSANPAGRVTVQAVRGYFALLRQQGNRDRSIVGRLEELQAALRILCPGKDFRWISAPGGISIRALLPMIPKHRAIRPTQELFDWGTELMEHALARPASQARRRQVQLRDGLMIAILASRGLRRRTIILMQLGQHVTRHSGRWRLSFGPDETKNGRPLEFDLPDRLTQYVDRYVDVERRELLAGAQHDAFWISWRGQPLSMAGMEQMVWSRSAKRFGEAFGPHRFRYALATTAMYTDPSHPGVAPAILGHGARVMEESYNRGGQVEAARQFTASLERERELTEGLARRAFAERRQC